MSLNWAGAESAISLAAVKQNLISLIFSLQGFYFMHQYQKEDQCIVAGILSNLILE